MKALVAMSGGVDSSVAAYLTRQQGYACIGCTMKLYEGEAASAAVENTCCSLDDIQDARLVAERLGMPYEVLNFSDGFREKVIDKFVQCYESGATPNPCIECNRYMKFDKLYARAKALGCHYIVTGHYARIEQAPDGRYLLKKALDETKDQSYVLYSLSQEQLSHTLFPLGSLRKAEVRRLAEESGFLNANKPDSQDICFVPDGRYVEFLERYTGKTYPRGRFITADGTPLGEHRGIVRYTVGQHKGLGLSLPEPMYVKEIRAGENTVVLCREEELYSREAVVRHFHWIAGEAPAAPVRCKAKVRYRQAEQWATVTPIGQDAAVILFDEPQRAITPGQAAVLYDGDTVLGGGTITEG